MHRMIQAFADLAFCKNMTCSFIFVLVFVRSIRFGCVPLQGHVLLLPADRERGRARGEPRVGVPGHALGQVQPWLAEAPRGRARVRCHQPHAAASKVSPVQSSLVQSTF